MNPDVDLVDEIKNEQLVYTAPPALDTMAFLRPMSPPGIVAEALLQPTRELIPAVEDNDDENSNDGDADCSLCLESLNSKSCSKIKICQHIFHRDCIRQCLQIDPKCPICRCVVGETPQGKSPSGTMRISLLKRKQCPGFPATKNTIKINYHIPAGEQQGYHENPGQPFSGTNREAYLPDDRPGRELLARLVFAWKNGMTFAIGTSLTSGKSNTVTWASIHHKTSLSGGAHGFPDPHFLENCHESLTALGVAPSPPFRLAKRFRSAHSIAYNAPVSISAMLDVDSVLEHLTRDPRPVDLFPTIDTCRVNVPTTSPSGTMTVVVTDEQFPGYAPSIKVVEVIYEIPDGIQATYHESPGTPYLGATRVAYLPSTPQGGALLTRLKYAFVKGLTFKVGTSLTSGMSHIVTWSSICHKTSLQGGEYGFPDLLYFDKCNQSLTALAVPEAPDCIGSL